MDGHQPLPVRRRVADGMHAGVLPGQDLAAAHRRLVLQVHVAVGGHVVAAFGRLALDDPHRADRARVIVRRAGLAGKPGHHQQVVGVAHDHRDAVVAPRCRPDVGRHVLRRQRHPLHGMAERSQRRLLAEAHPVRAPGREGGRSGFAWGSPTLTWRGRGRAVAARPHRRFPTRVVIQSLGRDYSSEFAG